MHGNGIVETVTWQSNGTRHRQTRGATLPDGTILDGSTELLQCDLQRVVIVNDHAHLYAVEPVPAPLPTRATLRAATIDTRPVVETRVIDAADTGERRVVGPLTARHVITTTTVERSGAPPRVSGIRDGWYVDVPRGCDEGRAEAVLVAGNAGGRVEVKLRGVARIGVPIDERDRMNTGGGEVVRRTDLVEVSGAPIPESVFQVPDGYGPALPTPGGGHDMTRPDTIANRVSVLWTYTARWVLRWWS